VDVVFNERVDIVFLTRGSFRPPFGLLLGDESVNNLTLLTEQLIAFLQTLNKIIVRISCSFLT